MIVVATTLHAYVTDQADTSLAWLYNAEAIAASHPEGVQFFAALELDARGLDPFAPLIARMSEIRNKLRDDIDLPWRDYDYWTFSFDDHATEIRTDNRVRRITMGQNMANDYAMSVGASHLLFCAADCAPDPDVLPKLLELDHPICGPEIPTYCLSGPTPTVTKLHGVSGDAVEVDEPLFPFPVQEHMASAACILLARDVFRQLRWRSDGDAGMTDDPCLHHDALTYLGIPTYVRKDVFARHYPEAIGSIESRHPGDARRIHR